MLSYFCTIFTRYINKEIDKIKLRHKKKTQPLKFSTLITQSLSVSFYLNYQELFKPHLLLSVQTMSLSQQT